MNEKKLALGCMRIANLSIEEAEKLILFAVENNIKLFRSTTEGNILIKLMNIDFQPNETLGRRLYSFTATAV